MDPVDIIPIIDTLEPHMGQNERLSWISPAFNGPYPAIYRQIDWSGPPRKFTVHLVELLNRYGEIEAGRPALAYLLETLYPQVGVDVQAEINQRLVEMGQPALSESPTGKQIKARKLRLWWSIAGGMLIVLIALWIINWMQPAFLGYPLCKSHEHCILLADFTPQTYDFAQKTTMDVWNQLDTIVGGDEPTFIVHRIDAVTSEREALKMAEKHNALLVIWGHVLTTEADQRIFRFTLTNRLSMRGPNSVRPFRLQPNYDDIGGELSCETNCLRDQGPVNQRISAVAHAAKGLLYYTREDFEAAEDEFYLALEADPVSSVEERVFAGPLCDPAFIDAAISQPKALKQGWEPDLLRYYLGRTLTFRGNYGLALAQLHQVAHHNPMDPAIWTSIAIACQSWLGSDLALEVAPFWKRAINLNIESQDSATLAFNRATIYELQGDFSAARDDYNKALDFQTDEDEEPTATYAARIGRARAEAKLEQYTIARDVLKTAIEADEKAIWAYVELARLDDQTRQEATNWLDQARKTTASQQYPGNMNIHLTQGALCDRWADYPCAKAAYQQALAYAPKSGWLRRHVGDFYFEHEKWILAYEQYAKAAEYRPNDPAIYDRLGYVSTALSEFERAAAEYQQAIELAYSAGSAADSYCALALVQQADDLPGRERSLQLCSKFSDKK